MNNLQKETITLVFDYFKLASTLRKYPNTIINLPKDILHKYKSYLCWPAIGLFQKLTEDIISDFADMLWWEDISKNQILSEEFIRQYHDKVFWSDIFKYQNLSLKFKKEFSYRTNGKFI